MKKYKAKALDMNTWPDFARLVEANNGVCGGCWCMWYHARDDSAHDTPELRRKAKECLVQEGRAHAALVYEGDACIGWCQFGSPDEIQRIHNERAYLTGSSKLPDWRITCFFFRQRASRQGHRGKGVAAAALAGALAQIEALGDGRVEAYLEDTEGRKASAAFLFNGAMSTFERQGFKSSRQIGKHKWVVTKIVK